MARSSSKSSSNFNCFQNWTSAREKSKGTDKRRCPSLIAGAGDGTRTRGTGLGSLGLTTWRRPHLHQLYCFAAVSRRVSEDSPESCLKRQPQEAPAHCSIFSVRLEIRRHYRALEQHARGNFVGILFALECFK